MRIANEGLQVGRVYPGSNIGQSRGLLRPGRERIAPRVTGRTVEFLDGNPVVGYSRLKGGVRLLFWSGQSFTEPGLKPEGSFKAAEARYAAVDQVDSERLRRWLVQAREIQWDYKNIVRRKGQLERLK